MSAHLKIVKTVEQLQQETADVLAYGNFLDKRTPVEQWEQALRQAQLQAFLLDKSHAKLKALGFERGVLGLI